MMKNTTKNTAKKHKGKGPLKTALIILALLIIIANTPPIQFFTLGSYRYQNRDNSFSYLEQPGKGLDFKVGQLRWERFLSENPNSPDRRLYRTFRINPLKFWEWWQFIAHHQRYTLPYLDANKT